MKDLESFYKNKRVLVTGGAGFIGSHIAEAASSYGAKVTILDDLSSGSIDNIESFKQKVNLIAKDITCLKSCIKATKKQDVVFHTAAFISVPESVKKPFVCEKINVEGTHNLLESCSINKVKTFIFSSSAAVYGERNNKCTECDKTNPQSPYAKSKLKGEELCKIYAKENCINTASLRYFNVYGSRQKADNAYSGVVAKFSDSILHNKPIVIYGDGNQKRDFVPVEEVVKANLTIGSMKHLKGDIFNIATGTSITLIKLIEKLEKKIGKKRTEIKFEPAREGDIVYSSADCKKYSSLLTH